VDVYSEPSPLGPVILDFDGVLVDASPCWNRAIGAMFARYGHDYSDAHRAFLIGRHPDAVGALLAVTIGRPELAAGLAREAMSRGLDEVSRGVMCMPGAFDLVRGLQGRRALAVASNTPRLVVERVLEHAGLRDAFSFVVGSDDVGRPKPAPDVYVAACERLGCSVVSATAIEDSMPGVTAARGAGVYVIAVSTRDSVRSAADESYTSLHDEQLLARLMRGRVHSA
jgi:HAD superfamily hydrolase (TIGR01509 family)